MSYKSKAMAGVQWTTLSSLANAATQVIQIAVLSFFLDKSDFGLMAITMVVIGFSQIFIDVGISNAIIFKQNITHNQLSSLYWLNIFSGIIIYFVIAALSPLISEFYNEPELLQLIVIVSPSFVIQPLGQQYKLLFQKNLMFKIIGITEVAGRILSLCVGIVTAILGFGVYALVFSTLIFYLFCSIVYVITGLKMHKPSLHFKWSEIKDFLNFGLYQLGEKTVNYFDMQFDTLIIGKLLGVHQLGIYNIAKDLTLKPIQIVNPIITRVSFPVMAKFQDNIETLKTIYLKTLKALSSVNFIMFTALAIFAEPIIVMFFGDGWEATIPVMQILAIYSLVRSTINPVGSLVLAKGRADLSFYWNLIVFCVVPPAIYIGCNWGISGVAYSLLIVQSLLVVPCWKILVNKICKASLSEYVKVFFMPLLIAVFSGAAAFLAMFFIKSIILSFIAGIICFSFVGIILSIYFNKVFINYFADLVPFKFLQKLKSK